MFSLLTIWKYTHFQAILYATANVTFNSSFVFFKITPNQGVIYTVGGSVKKLLRQICNRQFAFGDYHYSRGSFIKSMNKAWTRFAMFAYIWQVLKMEQKSIYQCAIKISVSGMHHQTSLFVEYDHIGILKQNIQRNVFRMNGLISWWISQNHFDYIARFYLVIRFYG